MRRDLRLNDNTGLFHAMNGGLPVMVIFIFDTEILDKLEDKDDARITFLHSELLAIDKSLQKKGSHLAVFHGNPQHTFQKILTHYNVNAVFANYDYEPYAKERDKKIETICKENGVSFHAFKDQVIFDKDKITTQSQSPYKVFTPYKNVWLKTLKEDDLEEYPSALYFENFYKDAPENMPSLEKLGFTKSHIKIPGRSFPEKIIAQYDKYRDFPALKGTSRMGIHLRHGTISIRQAVKKAQDLNDTWLNELIWREFYMQILDHFPHAAKGAFKKEYDNISWKNNEDHFERWCEGKTGYPIVDAGMRQLNETGYMHNRLRMVTASFLTKHLLIDWRWGEAYFARKLLDFELSSNNGGWQWAAGTGTDAQPYFRVFNPYTQQEKFDKNNAFIKEWVPEFDSGKYPEPIVDHKTARELAIKTYKQALGK